MADIALESDNIPPGLHQTVAVYQYCSSMVLASIFNAMAHESESDATDPGAADMTIMGFYLLSVLVILSIHAAVGFLDEAMKSFGGSWKMRFCAHSPLVAAHAVVFSIHARKLFAVALSRLCHISPDDLGEHVTSTYVCPDPVILMLEDFDIFRHASSGYVLMLSYIVALELILLIRMYTFGYALVQAGLKDDEMDSRHR